MIKKYLHLIILALIHALFFWYAAVNQNIYLKDSFEYLNLAENIVKHGVIYSGNLEGPFQEQFVSLRPPVYGVFIALIKSVNESDFFVLIVQSILSLLSICMLLKLVSIYFSKYNKWIIVMALVFFSSQFIYCNFIMSEILFQFLIIAFIYLHALYFTKKKYIVLLYAQIILSVMILTKPVSLIIFLFYLPYAVFLIFKNRFRPIILLFLIIPLFTFLGYQYYNYQKTGYYHYSSITSTYLLNYQLYKTLLISESESSAIETINRINNEAEKEKVFKSYSKKRMQLTLTELNDYKRVFTAHTIKGVFTFFLDVGVWDINQFFLSKHISNRLFIEVYKLISLLVCVTMLCLFLYSITLIRNNPIIGLLILVIVAVCLASGINGTARFRLPVELPLIMLCIFSLQSPHIKAFTNKINAYSL